MKMDWVLLTLCQLHLTKQIWIMSYLHSSKLLIYLAPKNMCQKILQVFILAAKNLHKVVGLQMTPQRWENKGHSLH